MATASLFFTLLMLQCLVISEVEVPNCVYLFFFFPFMEAQMEAFSSEDYRSDYVLSQPTIPNFNAASPLF